MKLRKLIILSSILLLGGAFYILYKNINPTSTEIFPQCPTYKYLHFYCPGCGSQRAVHQLLNGDIQSAWSYNPLLIILLPLFIYIGGVYFYNFFFDKTYRIPLFYNNTFVWGFFVVVILYFILRNVPWESLEFLRPPFNK